MFFKELKKMKLHFVGGHPISGNVWLKYMNECIEMGGLICSNFHEVNLTKVKEPVASYSKLSTTTFSSLDMRVIV